MSQIISVNKSYSYDSAPLKTPNIKKEPGQDQGSYEPSNKAIPHPPIIMDEYGQTPDHYYLARKPPPSFFQVKRKLDLQTVSTTIVDDSKPNKNRSRRKVPEKRGRNTVEKPRYDTSLGQLTKKFLKLLSDATDGVINLNTACSMLSVPKRRLYDITNVLEGAGLIQKTSRNNIQWKGRIGSACGGNAVKYDIEKEIDMLEAKENKLDELIYYMQSEIESIKQEDAKYAYITSDDLKEIQDFSEKCLIAVNTPSSVYVAESNEKTVVVSSKSDEIEAYLLYKGLSFTNILHSKAVLTDDSSYKVKVVYDTLFETSKKEDATEKKDIKQGDIKQGDMKQGDIKQEDIKQEPEESPPEYSENPLLYNNFHSSTLWTEGDTIYKNAFITDEDDIAPMGKNFLLQTEDQDHDFFLETAAVENYSFSLDDGEGLTDLFDCDFPSP